MCPLPINTHTAMSLSVCLRGAVGDLLCQRTYDYLGLVLLSPATRLHVPFEAKLSPALKLRNPQALRGSRLELEWWSRHLRNCGRSCAGVAVSE